LKIPRCGDLVTWAAKYNAGETIGIAPKVEVSALLREEWVKPVFGKLSAEWAPADFSQVKRQLKH